VGEDAEARGGLKGPHHGEEGVDAPHRQGQGVDEPRELDGHEPLKGQVKEGGEELLRVHADLLSPKAYPWALREIHPATAPGREGWW